MGTIKLRIRMKYLSTTEIAKIWGVSRKTVTRYAADGKIEGAYLVGNTWMIPATAQKEGSILPVFKVFLFHKTSPQSITNAIMIIWYYQPLRHNKNTIVLDRTYLRHISV